METRLDDELDMKFGDLLDAYTRPPENAFTKTEFIEAVKETSGATISYSKAERDLTTLVNSGKLKTKIVYSDGRIRRYYWRPK